MRARFADGPFAGQTIEFPHPGITGWAGGEPVFPLLWVAYGPDRHAFTLRRNDRGWDSFRLIYRDTF